MHFGIHKSADLKSWRFDGHRYRGVWRSITWGGFKEVKAYWYLMAQRNISVNNRTVKDSIWTLQHLSKYQWGIDDSSDISHVLEAEIAVSGPIWSGDSCKTGAKSHPLSPPLWIHEGDERNAKIIQDTLPLWKALGTWGNKTERPSSRHLEVGSECSGWGQHDHH